MLSLCLVLKGRNWDGTIQNVGDSWSVDGVGVWVCLCLEVPVRPGCTEAGDSLQALGSWVPSLWELGNQEQVGPHWWVDEKHYICFQLQSKFYFTI